MSGKNLRLLGEERSAGWQPTLGELIRELQHELARGEAVYTPAELARLAGKLADYEEMLRLTLTP
jgi:hypothetical protein